jgi:hypothetical protein
MCFALIEILRQSVCLSGRSPAHWLAGLKVSRLSQPAMDSV